MPDAGALSIQTEEGVTLAGEQAGMGPAIVLLHGLTATRRYVLMGSRLLERSGHRVIAYDARGHGSSTPARDPTAYGYAQLAADLETVLDALELPRATLAGASMGAHTALRFALDHPDRVAGLAIITPAYDPSAPRPGNADGSRRPALAQALREGGAEGFVSAYDFSTLRPEWRETVRRALRQRLAAHEHPEAVADAMEVLGRDRPFDRLSELGAIRAPTLVVASRDEADPDHPLALAERYGASIPGAQLAVEEAGPPPRSPIAWQGAQVSKLLAALAARAYQSSPDT
jgi:pimeloyl-ACP methyl ester carboxylesterase